MDQRINHFLRIHTPFLIVLLVALLSVSFHQIQKKPCKWCRKKSNSNAYREKPKIFASSQKIYIEPKEKYIRPQMEIIPKFFKNWRKNFIQTLSQSDPRGVVSGIFLGDDSNIPFQLKQNFKITGLYHLLAASGFNCWIVSFFFILIGRGLYYAIHFHLKSVSVLKLKKYIPTVFQIIGAWLFWFWSDQSPPINRAVLMISVATTLKLLQIHAPFSRSLIVLYFISLIVKPALFSSASFQLTYGCLFGLLWIPKWVEVIRKKLPLLKENKILNLIWVYVFTNIGACIGTIPALWFWFNEINFTSVFTNFFATPIVSLFIMPISLTVMLILPLVNGDNSTLEFFSQTATTFTNLLIFLVDVYISNGPILRYAN